MKQRRKLHAYEPCSSKPKRTLPIMIMEEELIGARGEAAADAEDAPTIKDGARDKRATIVGLMVQIIPMTVPTAGLGPQGM